MEKKIPYLNRKGDIRAALISLAQAGQTIFYSDFGIRLGIPTRGPWKPVLDEISREERNNELPDITYLVISKVSGLPNQIGYKLAKPPTPEQRRDAAEMYEKIFARYRKPEAN